MDQIRAHVRLKDPSSCQLGEPLILKTILFVRSGSEGTKSVGRR